MQISVSRYRLLHQMDRGRALDSHNRPKRSEFRVEEYLLSIRSTSGYYH